MSRGGEGCGNSNSGGSWVWGPLSSTVWRAAEQVGKQWCSTVGGRSGGRRCSTVWRSSTGAWYRHYVGQHSRCGWFLCGLSAGPNSPFQSRRCRNRPRDHGGADGHIPRVWLCWGAWKRLRLRQMGAIAAGQATVGGDVGCPSAGRGGAGCRGASGITAVVPPAKRLAKR